MGTGSRSPINNNIVSKKETESSKMTITEALAEIKTIEKRLQSKREFVLTYLMRFETMKDPLEKDGGSAKVVKSEQQAISDLENRIVELRRLIQKANEDTKLTIEGEERSIADWLVWRREVAPGQEQFLYGLRSRLTQARQQVSRQQPTYGRDNVPEKPLDIVVSINESDLAKSTEKVKSILGQLDGLLSLKNATVVVA